MLLCGVCVRLACKFTFFSAHALRFACFFCACRFSVPRFASSSFRFARLLPPRGVRLCGRLCRTAPLDRVENRSSFFRARFFFLGLIAPARRGGFFLRRLNVPFVVLFIFLYILCPLHTVHVHPSKWVCGVLSAVAQGVHASFRVGAFSAFVCFVPCTPREESSPHFVQTSLLSP